MSLMGAKWLVTAGDRGKWKWNLGEKGVRIGKELSLPTVDRWLSGCRDRIAIRRHSCRIIQRVQILCLFLLE